MDEMDEIVEEFLVESHEGLDRLDAEFVRLEADPEDVGVLDGIFRDVHSIKGTSGFLGYGKLESVAHVGENLLSRLRDRELRLTESRTSALLAMVDALREILTAIESSGEEGPVDYTPLVARLEAATSEDASPDEPTGQAPAAPTAAAPTPAPTVAPAPPGRRPIGEILRETAGVSEADIEAAYAAQAAGDPRHLGEILVEAGAVGSETLVQALHSQSAADRGRSAADSTIRVDVDLLDNLMNLVGELVLARNQIMQHTGTSASPGMLDTTQRLNLITTELQEGVMKTRMQPIGNVFSKFPRVVRDLSLSLGKQISVTMEGTDTELDKTIIEAIKDPLTHMVRNSVDHGVESPDVRTAAGKPAQGNLLLRAYHEGGQVNIEITDDGGGIDPARIAAKAVEKGVVGAEQVRAMSERDVVNLIFAPGFSTAETVSNISGRGVGMDVVRTSIERIGGSVDVTSTLGAGTTTRIRIPLTLAIIPALIVAAGEAQFAIPQVSLLELVGVEAGEVADAVEEVHGAPVHRLRGNLLPLVHLHEQLDIPPPPPDAGLNIVVLQADNQQFGLVVEAIDDTAEIVVKPLGQALKAIPIYAGATIMGDGRVSLILDVLGIAEQAGITSRPDAVARHDDQASTGTEAEALLVVGLGPTEDAQAATRLAVPLRQIARLEEVDHATVEHAGGQPVIQYRDEILPLVWLADTLGVAADVPGDLLQVIVYERGDRQVGLVVDHIHDVVHDSVVVQRPSTRRGLLGSGVVDGRVTDLLDVDAVIAMEVPDLLVAEDEAVLAGAAR